MDESTAFLYAEVLCIDGEQHSVGVKAMKKEKSSVFGSKTFLFEYQNRFIQTDYSLP